MYLIKLIQRMLVRQSQNLLSGLRQKICLIFVVTQRNDGALDMFCVIFEETLHLQQQRAVVDHG